MLCSRCYKEISKGKEVDKSGFIPWQDRWGTFCKKCAKKLDEQRKVFWVIFFSWWFLSIIALLIAIIKGK